MLWGIGDSPLVLLHFEYEGISPRTVAGGVDEQGVVAAVGSP